MGKLKPGNLEWRKKYVLRKIKEFSKHPLISFEDDTVCIRFDYLYNSMACTYFDTITGKVVGFVFDIPSICSIKKSVLEYLVLHELCHARYQDHGRAFQDLLAEVSGIRVYGGQTYNHPDFNLPYYIMKTGNYYENSI